MRLRTRNAVSLLASHHCASRSCWPRCGDGRDERWKRDATASGSGSDDRRERRRRRRRRSRSTPRTVSPTRPCRDHRRHHQVRHEPAAVGHLLRVRVDPAGRAGVLRLPQRRAGRRRHRAARSTRSSWSPRTTPTTPQTTVTNVQKLVDDDDVFGLFNVVGTKNNLAIRDFVNDGLRPEPLRGDRFAGVGQSRLPVAARHDARAVPARDEGVRRLPRREQARRDDRDPARRRRLRRLRTPRR